MTRSTRNQISPDNKNMTNLDNGIGYLPVDRVKNTTAGSDAAQSRSFLHFSFWLQYRHDGQPCCQSGEEFSAQAHLENPTIKNNYHSIFTKIKWHTPQ